MYLIFAVIQLANISYLKCDIPELRGDNYKVWKERILLHLGWMDIDYAIRKEEPDPIIETSTAEAVCLYNKWERSNRLSVMFIKTKISAGIRGSIEQITKVKPLLKAIDEQFKTSDKALIPNVKQKVIEQHNQSNYMQKQKARIYIPPAIVKKPRKLENWKYFGSSKPFSKTT